MRLLECILPPDHDLHAISDTHDGSIAQYEAGLDETIVSIHDEPMAYACHLGDWSETLMVNHPYYNPTTLMKDAKGNPSLPLTQVYHCADVYRPITEKLVAFLQGNHELRAWSFGDTTDLLLRLLNIPEIYGGYICKLNVRIKARNKEGSRPGYKIMLYHGRSLVKSRAGTEKQRLANMEASLQRILAPMTGDCVIQAMAHIHQLIISKPIKRLYLTDDGQDLKQHYITHKQSGEYIDPESRYYLCTGSFLKSQMVGQDTYSEIRGYAPVELGYPIIRVRDGKIWDIEPNHL